MPESTSSPKPTVTPAPAKPTPIVVDTKESLIVRLHTLEKYYKEWAGKKGHNPFFKLTELNKLKDNLNKHGMTDDLCKQIAEFKMEPPVV